MSNCNNPKFSIIVPMFNISKYIEKCIVSINNQSYSNYEVIVVDDGSTDGSAEIVQKYLNDNIKLYVKKNGGLSSARNYGMQYATGDYIWFIDGDDFIEPNSIELLASKIMENAADIISFDYYITYENRREVHRDRFANNSVEYTPLRGSSAWSRIYKRDFLKKNNIQFAEGLLYEDLELIPYLLCMADSVVFIDDVLYNYVQRQGSIMNQKKFSEKMDDRFIVLERLYEKYKTFNIYDKYKEQLIFLAIKHLVILYSQDLLMYDREIYYSRLNKINKYLESLNRNWTSNIYLKMLPMSHKIYVNLFKRKMYNLCKCIVKVKNRRIK